MRYEVEKKFYVNNLVEIESRLREMGGRVS